MLGAGALLLLFAAACGDDPESGVEDDLKDAPATEDSTMQPPDHTPATGVPVALWVTASGSGEVYRVDVATGEVETVEVGHNLYDVEHAAGALWLAGAADSLHRLDLDTRDVEEVVAGGVREIAVAGDELWLALGDPDGVARLAPSSGALGELVEAADVNSMVADGEAVWAWPEFGSEITRVDTTTGEATSGQVTSSLGAVAVDGDVLWAAGADELSRVDPSTLEAEAVAELPARATAALAAPDSDVVWLAYEGGSMASYDAATGTLSDPVQVARDDVTDLELVGDTVWAGAEDGSLSALDATTLELEESVELPEAANRLRIAVER